MPEIRGFATGTLGLWLLLAISVGICRERPLRALDRQGRRRIRVVGATAVAAQAIHFLEELSTGFYRAFPPLLGLQAWDRRTFVIFNVVWLGIWVASVRVVPGGRRGLEWALWFLAAALLANGVAHPILAWMRRAYFPGLVTAIAAGVAGVWLLRTLWDLSRPKTRDVA